MHHVVVFCAVRTITPPHFTHSTDGSTFGAARKDFRAFGEGVRGRFLRRLDEAIDKFEKEVREAL